MRYLLRAPSTPWITFDKDSKAEVLTSSRSSILDTAGVFPDAPAATAATPNDAAYASHAEPTPPVEPSNVVVATDINPPDDSAREATLDTTRRGSEPVIPVATPHRIIAAVGGCLGLAAMIIIAVFVFGKKNEPSESAKTTAVSAPSAPADVAPANLDIPPAVVAPAPPTTAAVKSEKTGWARLTIKGPAKGHRVYLDGKLLLGQGQRTFMIRCGDHTIAIGNKTDAKDVDVPCNGEYVVSK